MIRLKAIAAAVFLIIVLALPVFTAGEMPFQKSFEGGKLYRIGEMRFLDLSGSYRQMGRQ